MVGTRVAKRDIELNNSGVRTDIRGDCQYQWRPWSLQKPEELDSLLIEIVFLHYALCTRSPIN